MANPTSAALFNQGNNVAAGLLSTNMIPGGQPLLISFLLTYLAKNTDWGDPFCFWSTLPAWRT